ncbi:MAG: hypothetical protein ACOX5R_16610 [bacterium]|jgi:hypothetical protein
MKTGILVSAMLGTFLPLACVSQQTTPTTVVEHPDFEQLCSQCHTLDRVHRAHEMFSEEQMKEIVERMAQKEGSTIDPMNIDDIVKQIY